MRKWIAGIIVMLTVLGVGILPQQLMQRLERLTVVTPQPYSYQPDTGGSGIVAAAEGVKMVVSSNVIIKELCYPDGSWVSAGDVIAITEPPAPAQVFLNQSMDTPSASFDQSQLAGMAAQYGFELPQAAGGIGQQELTQSLAAPQQATAPIGGILRWNDASTGRFLPAGSQLCTILGTDSYRAVVQVAAEQAKEITVGAAAYITGSEIDNRTYYGTVKSVGNTISHGVTTGGYSSTVDVEITIDAPADSIRHGASVSCTIHTGEPQVLLTLPYEAVQQDERNREYVYCVYGNSLRKQYVETGLELEDCVEILSGVDYDNAVVAGNPANPEANFILESD